MYKCLSSPNVATKKGQMTKGSKERIRKYVMRKAMFICLAVCEVFSWSYVTALIIWVFPTYCKDAKRKTRAVCQPDLEAGQA